MLNSFITPKRVKQKRLRKKLDKFKAIRSKRGYLNSAELSHMINTRDELYLLTYGG